MPQLELLLYGGKCPKWENREKWSWKISYKWIRLHSRTNVNLQIARHLLCGSQTYSPLGEPPKLGNSLGGHLVDGVVCFHPQTHSAQFTAVLPWMPQSVRMLYSPVNSHYKCNPKGNKVSREKTTVQPGDGNGGWANVRQKGRKRNGKHGRWRVGMRQKGLKKIESMGKLTTGWLR